MLNVSWRTTSEHSTIQLLAVIRQLGTPIWFFTLSAADLKWPDMIQTIAKEYGVHYTDEEVAALSFEDRFNWLKRNPVTAARHFSIHAKYLFMKSNAHPLVEVVEYRLFLNRGSPHAHCIIWIEDALKYDVDNDNVCVFIDQYVSCSIPGEEKLHIIGRGRPQIKQETKFKTKK